MTPIVVLITAKNSLEARKIAKVIVRKKMAACCNILPAIRSIYQWEGKLCDDAEVLMIVKTTRNRFPALEKEVKALHSYSVPEIIALPIVLGSKPYVRWLGQSVGNP
ncbi:MAG: divalent-cation tolerance protein CutA [Candidatus Omnitrophica bacterium]|nr:divalent-cation tolerance protein CutA [Candidatus Omnitrophota bacterium]